MGTEKLDSISCAHVEAEEGYKRSLFLSPVPTLRRKKGTEKLAPVTCAHAATEEGHREACSCHLCPYCGGRRVQRSLPLSPVPTLRQKKGTRGRSPHDAKNKNRDL